jgi:hypothetical protein
LFIKADTNVVTMYRHVGFPSTQQAEKINAKAKQQKAEQEKLKIIEAEWVQLFHSRDCQPLRSILIIPSN